MLFLHTIKKIESRFLVIQKNLKKTALKLKVLKKYIKELTLHSKGNVVEHEDPWVYGGHRLDGDQSHPAF